MVRWIDKGASPHCLAGKRSELRRVERDSGKPTVAGDWAPSPCTQDIRDALHRDQHGLCAYCTKRIQTNGHRDKPDNGGMRIEHIQPRACDASKMYDWENLLGVCGGRHGSRAGTVEEYCDRARGDSALVLNPLKRAPHDPQDVFRYRRDQRDSRLLMESDHPDVTKDIATLNLNAGHLSELRREAEKTISSALARLRGNRSKENQLLRNRLITAATPDGKGLLPPFAQVVERYIRRQLNKRGLSPPEQR